MISVINRDNLVNSTATVGDYLYQSLASLKSAEGKMLNLRGEGEGTFIAFDCATPEKRDAFVKGMKDVGVNMGGCGERAVRLRYVLSLFSWKECTDVLGID